MTVVSKYHAVLPYIFIVSCACICTRSTLNFAGGRASPQSDEHLLEALGRERRGAVTDAVAAVAVVAAHCSSAGVEILVVPGRLSRT